MTLTMQLRDTLSQCEQQIKKFPYSIRKILVLAQHKTRTPIKWFPSLMILAEIIAAGRESHNKRIIYGVSKISCRTLKHVIHVVDTVLSSFKRF